MLLDWEGNVKVWILVLWLEDLFIRKWFSGVFELVVIVIVFVLFDDVIFGKLI